jgi:riboflavin kinase
MHDFKSDFYGRDMQAVILGYIRPELDYTSKGSPLSLLASTMQLLTSYRTEALIEDINTDKRVALASLSREAYMKFGVDPNSSATEERAPL